MFCKDELKNQNFKRKKGENVNNFFVFKIQHKSIIMVKMDLFTLMALIINFLDISNCFKLLHNSLHNWQHYINWKRRCHPATYNWNEIFIKYSNSREIISSPIVLSPKTFFPRRKIFEKCGKTLWTPALYIYCSVHSNCDKIILPQTFTSNTNDIYPNRMHYVFRLKN